MASGTPTVAGPTVPAASPWPGPVTGAPVQTNAAIPLVLHGQPLGRTHPAAGLTPAPVLPSPSGRLVNCDPYRSGPVLQGTINFTVAVTPANGSGVGPVDFTWNYTIYGGGLPPFITETIVAQQTRWTPSGSGNFTLPFTYYSWNSSGNLTLNETGIYVVDFEVGDATCTQAAQQYWQLQVVNSTLGATPVHPSVSTASAQVPVNITESVNASALPANYSIIWEGLDGQGLGTLDYRFDYNGSTVTNRYVLAGTLATWADVLEPGGVLYAQVPAPTVLLRGPGPIAVQTQVSPGPMPQNVTIWANVTNRSALPSSFSLSLSSPAWPVGVSNSSTNGSVSLKFQQICGFLNLSASHPPDPSGVCQLQPADLVFSSTGNPQWGLQFIPIQMLAAGNLSDWYPVKTVSYTLTNVTNATQLAVNFSLSQGTPGVSWHYQADLFGHSTTNTTGVFYPTTYWSANPWNGTLVAINATLNQTGVYWFEASAWDQAGGYELISLPLIGVGLVLPTYYAMSVHATEANATAVAQNVTGLAVTFALDTTGGLAPYTVQWAFGDGSYGTSDAVGTVTHLYGTPGQYTPMVTVTDATDRSSSLRLATVTVNGSQQSTVGPSPPAGTDPASFEPPPPATTPPANRSTSPPSLAPELPAWPGWLGVAAVLAAVGVAAGAVLIRRELRLDGEALLASPAETATPEAGRARPSSEDR